MSRERITIVIFVYELADFFVCPQGLYNTQGRHVEQELIAQGIISLDRHRCAVHKILPLAWGIPIVVDLMIPGYHASAKLVLESAWEVSFLGAAPGY
jgi:hypothetical protein